MTTRRQTKYTATQINAALDRVRRGYSVPEAARLSGVDKGKIYREMREDSRDA